MANIERITDHAMVIHDVIVLLTKLILFRMYNSKSDGVREFHITTVFSSTNPNRSHGLDREWPAIYPRFF
jgi:hypothetical protein